MSNLSKTLCKHFSRDLILLVTQIFFPILPIFNCDVMNSFVHLIHLQKKGCVKDLSDGIVSKYRLQT